MSTPFPSIDPRLLMAQRQMELAGTTAEQASAYRGRLSKNIFNAISPVSYGVDTRSVAMEILKAYLTGQDVSPRNPSSLSPMGELGKEANDAWALYLGLPQRHRTWRVSNYTPSNSSDQNTIYYAPVNSPLTTSTSNSIKPEDKIKAVLEAISTGKGSGSGGLFVHNGRSFDERFNLGRFQWTKGRDKRGPYIAYYDIWDLAANPFEGVIGKPFEVYDRIYYDPKTFKPIQPETELSAQIKAARQDVTFPIR